MGELTVRATRMIDIEKDAALRIILRQMLAESTELELRDSYAKTDNELNRTIARKADIARIDFALDQNGLNEMVQR